LCVNVDPEVQGLNLAPKKRENKQESKVVPPRESKPPERVEVEVEASQDDEPSTQEQEGDEEVVDLATPAPPQVIEQKQSTEVESNVPAGETPYALRERKPVDYNPGPQLRRPAVRLLIIEPEDPVPWMISLGVIKITSLSSWSMAME